MKERATSAIAIMPIANASGAAGPANCATKVMLNAAVTVGETTESDRPNASRSRRRDTKLVIPYFSFLWRRPLSSTMSPHHEWRHIRIRHQPIADICHGLINDRGAFVDFGL